MVAATEFRSRGLSRERRANEFGIRDRSRSRSASRSVDPRDAKIDSLCDQVAKLAEVMSKLVIQQMPADQQFSSADQHSGRGRSWSRERGRSDRQSGGSVASSGPRSSPGLERDVVGEKWRLCWYHKTWGERADHCEPPCEYNEKN